MYPNRALTKGIAVAFLVFFGSFVSLAQPFSSINIEGSRFEGVNTMHIESHLANSFVAFGATRHLGVQFFDFFTGELSSIRTIQTVNNTRIPIEGAGGVLLNPAEFILIGQIPDLQEEDKVLVVKGDTTGRVLWARTFIQNFANQADKIWLCQNGDVLFSMMLNIRENSTGEAVFGSALVRMDTAGNLLWYKNLDLRTDTESEVIGVQELASGTLVIAQNYSQNLRLLKLSASGHLIHSSLSNATLEPAAVAFNKQTQQFFIAGKQKTLLRLDSSLNTISYRTYASNDVRSFRTVTVLQSGDIAIGADYLNRSCVIRCTDSGGPVEVFSNENSGYATSVLQGLFETATDLISISSPGFAVTKHAADLSSSCFQSLGGSVLGTTIQANPGFAPSDSVAGQTSVASLSSLSFEKQTPLIPSSNCLDYDLSIQAATINNQSACRNVDFRWYIYNHGTQAVNQFSITYYLYGQAFDSTFEVTPIPSKTGRFIDYGSAYLDPGFTRLTYKVHSPNGQQDAFAVNDSLFADYQGVNDVTFSYNLADTICQGDVQEVLVTGPNGIYALFKNNMLQEQSQSKFFVAQGAGSFYVRHTSAGGCFSFSDTLQVKELPKPPVPSITVDYDLAVLQSNALRAFWFFNSISQPGLVLVDSLVETIAYQGPGDYMVIDKSENGCSSEFLLSNIVVNTKLLEAPTSWPFVSQNTLFNLDSAPVYCEVYAMDGKRLWFNTLATNESVSLALSQGIYLLKTTKEGKRFNQKIWISH